MHPTSCTQLAKQPAPVRAWRAGCERLPPGVAVVAALLASIRDALDAAQAGGGTGKPVVAVRRAAGAHGRAREGQAACPAAGATSGRRNERPGGIAKQVGGWLRCWRHHYILPPIQPRTPLSHHSMQIEFVPLSLYVPVVQGRQVELPAGQYARAQQRYGCGERTANCSICWASPACCMTADVKSPRCIWYAASAWEQGRNPAAGTANSCPACDALRPSTGLCSLAGVSCCATNGHTCSDAACARGVLPICPSCTALAPPLQPQPLPLPPPPPPLLLLLPAPVPNSPWCEYVPGPQSSGQSTLPTTLFALPEGQAVQPVPASLKVPGGHSAHTLA